MADNIKAPSIHIPKSLADLLTEKGKDPSLRIFAGGSYIMARPFFYTDGSGDDIISITQIPELTKVSQTDRYLEAGACVTIEQLLNSGSYLMGKETFRAITSIASSMVRSQATIGGALCTPDTRFFLSCVLSTIGAQVEIRLLSKRGFKGHKITSSQMWLPVNKLYNSEGVFLYENKAILTKVRIPAKTNNIQVFRTLGNPMREMDSTVFFGFEYTPVPNGISHPNLCLAFPKNGFFQNLDFSNQLSSLSFPPDPQQIEDMAKLLEKKLEESCPSATPIQRERSRRLFVSILYQISQGIV